jgi:hypothetical protein
MKKLFCVAALFVFFAGCQDAIEDGQEIPVEVARGDRGADWMPEKRDTKKDPLPSNSDTAGFVVPESEEDEVRLFDGELSLKIPAIWIEAELTAMQRSVLLAKFQVPELDPRIEVTISSAGGGIDANFRRWHGQFAGGTKDEETIDFGQSTARVLSLTGDFTPGFGKPNGSDFALMGAAFPASNRDFYLKLTGPADKVKEMENEFRDLVRSATFLN